MNRAPGLEKWIWLASAAGFGSARGDELLAYFGTPDAIYDASRGEYRIACPGIRDAMLSRLENKSLDEAKKIIKTCEKREIRILTRDSEEYPERLRRIPQAPIVLYARGAVLDIDSEAAIAVVGTRNASAYGRQAAELFGREIAEGGGVVVSGLAKGIDSFALEGALAACGRCVAVLGCGVDVYYPKENAHLTEATAMSGTIMSEYPPGTAPDKRNFPRRNRIISGLSLGTVIVEAPEKSGALYTAGYALEQNRDVFAVPSGIFEETSAGTNKLLRGGATPVTSGREVLEEYRHLFGDRLSLESPKKKTAAPKKIKEDKTAEKKKDENENKEASFTPPPNLSEDEGAIVASVTSEALRADEIAARCSLPVGKVLSLLTLLEIRGVVLQLAGSRFKIRK